MRVLEFQIKGLTQDELRRRRKHQESAHVFQRFLAGWSKGARVLIWAALAVAALYILQWSYTPSATLNGHVFTGKNVIILEDISPSMRESEERRLTVLINQLKSSGISVDNRAKTQGGGFSATGAEDNSLKTLEQALKENPGADAIFVFSDFTNFDNPWDRNDAAGYQRLRDLLGRRRLYLGNVNANAQPPNELIRIARDSGGDLIEAK